MDTSLLGLCFDTGHSAFGGGNPLALLREAGELVNHVHFKDVDLELLARLHKEGKGLEEAWAAGVFCELGTGGAQVDECLQHLLAIGYDRWIVVEQDRILAPGESVRPRARVGRAQPRLAAGARPVSARETAARLGRLRGLDTLSDTRGIFALAAMDHRDSLRHRVRDGRLSDAAARAHRRAQGDGRSRARAARDGPPDRRGARRPGRSRSARPGRAGSSCRSRRRATRTSPPGA